MSYETEIVAALNHPDKRKQRELWQEIISGAKRKGDFSTLIRIASIRGGAPEYARLSAGLEAIDLEVMNGYWKITHDLSKCWDIMPEVRAVAEKKTETAALNDVKRLLKKRAFYELSRMECAPELPESVKSAIKEELAVFALETGREKGTAFIRKAKAALFASKEAGKRFLEKFRRVPSF